MLFSRYGLFLFGIPCFGTITLSVTSVPSAPQPVGTPIHWSVKASDTNSGQVVYQFSGSGNNGQSWMLQDFSLSNQFVWTVSAAEGDYQLQVIAKNLSSGETNTVQVPFSITSRVTGNSPVITPTANPLVALYSAPGCPSGNSLYVEFGTATGVTRTNALPCTPSASMNFYIGGMLPETTYEMHYVIVTGPEERWGSAQEFTTGSIDPTLSLPSISIVDNLSSSSGNSQPVLLLDYLSPPGGPYYFPTAVDLQGRVIWYYPALGVPAQNSTYFFRPIPNSQGHALLIADDPNYAPSDGQILREIDLAGNTVSQTNAATVSQQLVALGKWGITSFNHDAIRLPNGHTLVICAQERLFPAGTQGAAGSVDIVGDAIVDLDPKWQVAWSWSGYDHLDINRAAILGETCYGQPGCPPLTLATTANDWLHGNSLEYAPESGDILFSIRHQDWIVKIDYANGLGTGNVLWKLGLGGDFTIDSSDPYPWFSHQHNASFEPGTSIITLFDNGNTRVARNPNLRENSRGYALSINEANLSATQVFLADLGVYSPAVGTAQKLDNGDYHFHAGFVNPASPRSDSIEITPLGIQIYLFQDLTQTYRAYRMRSLYEVSSQDPRAALNPGHRVR
ncbi:MAG: aryl-sulfate sulfotransferase [Acidobacteriia bacterium]|nr:aryl-sulfate sulfotransferase [Terriglobia bacterium]